LARFEFKSGIVLFCFCFIFVSFRELRLLVSWCVGGRCGMTCSDEDRGRSRRPGADDQGWSHRSGTRWPDGCNRVDFLWKEFCFSHFTCAVHLALVVML
jgi:hypothetical protein